MYFIISDEDRGPRRPLLWCELPHNYYFTELNFAGESTENNEIFLDFIPGNNVYKILLLLVLYLCIL